MMAESGQASQGPSTLSLQDSDTFNSIERGEITPKNGTEEVLGKLDEDSIYEEMNYPRIHVRGDTITVIVDPKKYPIQSRYQRASVGSCHDLCKSGHRHEQEKRIKKPVWKAKSILNENTKKKHKSIDICSSEDDKHKSDRNMGGESKSEFQAGKKVIRSSDMHGNTTPRVKEIKIRKEDGSPSKGVSMSRKTPSEKYQKGKGRRSEDNRSTSKAQERSQQNEGSIQDLNSIETKQIGKTNNPRVKPTSDSEMNTKKTEISCLERPEEEASSSVKAKIRRGTMVSLQVTNSSPNKLPFNRARVMSNDQKATIEAGTRMKSKDSTSNESHVIKPRTKTVHFRHQNATINVTEEIASKPFKPQRIKVKALVRAFETVIFLHHSKHMVESGALSHS